MVWWVLPLRLSGLGFYIAICIVGGIVLGIWLDRIFDTRIIFFVVGLIVGCAAAFYGTYRMVVPLFGDLDHPDETGKGRNG